jgi:antitoxin CptB
MSALMDSKRLHWACRRGMLELDLLLEPYLIARYDQSTHDEQRMFINLLECNDQDLFDWLLKKKPADTSEHALMVTRILHHAYSKLST